MKYMGSKNRHAKDILPFLIRGDGTSHVEPFVGGANICDKITGDRICSDIDEDLICMWEAVSEGWLPPSSFTEDEYHAIKTEPVSPLRGYAAFALSYGGKKFGGWCRDSNGKRDYVKEAYYNAIRQFPKLKGVSFKHCDYRSLDVPDRSLVYCDPPYAGTTGYSKPFDHLDFWEWVRSLSSTCTVLVSEYTAPPDFTCIWSKRVTSSLTADTGSKTNVERLFTLI